MPEYPENHVILKPEALFLLALMLLVFPLRWILGFLTAVSVHELGHYLAIRFCGGCIYSFQIGIWGMRMETSALSAIQEFWASLAGPICGLILMIFCRKIPEIAICAGFQSVYNLLPVYPLDGGRALRSFLCWAFPEEVGERISSIAQTVFSVILFAVVLLIAIVLKLKMVPLVLLIWVWIRVRRKRPCKPTRKRLQ